MATLLGVLLRSQLLFVLGMSWHGSAARTLYAAIGPALNWTAHASTGVERFLPTATKHGPFFKQGHSQIGSTVQPWEQHITPFPSVLYNEAWARPIAGLTHPHVHITGATQAEQRGAATARSTSRNSSAGDTAHRRTSKTTSAIRSDSAVIADTSDTSDTSGATPLRHAGGAGQALGPYRLYYAVQTDCDAHASMRCQPNSCAIALAVSVDGTTWTKPHLGLCTFNGTRSSWNAVNNLVLCPASASASANHAIYHGGFDCNGVKLMEDTNPATAPSARFKLFGGFGKPQPNSTAGGTPYYISSPDGIHFPAAPVAMVAGVNATIRFDCFPDFSYDAATGRYIGIARGRRPGDFIGCGHSWYPQCATSTKHTCRVCSSNYRTFAFMTSPDLDTWTTSLPPQPATKEHQAYTAALFRFHDITLATVSVFEETTAPNDFGRVRCSLYYTGAEDVATGRWRAIGSRAGGDDLIAPGELGAFDWGLCYAAPPIVAAGASGSEAVARLYYWGVDGEHYSPHNASFGMATLRPGRYAGVRAIAPQSSVSASAAVDLDGGGAAAVVVATMPLNCTSTQLVVTVDTDTGGPVAGSLRAQIVGVPGLTFASSLKIVGVNVTNSVVLWNREPLPARVVGMPITVHFELGGGAALYSFGFTH